MAHRPSYAVHDGFRMPMGFPFDGFESALTYQSQPSDIFISTYPKCGTTWMQHIVWLILGHGEPLSAGEKMTSVIPHLEEVGAGYIEALPEPRVIKTHLPFEMTPHHPQARVIYVLRNPFDCAVSFFHHTRGFVLHYDFAQGCFDDYLACFTAGEVDFGDYFANVPSWLAHRQVPNFLFLTYEHMQADPRSAVIAVGKFLGPELGAAVHHDETLNRIVAHSSFSSMQRDQLRWASKRPEGMPEFVREGVVGDWINHFSPAGARAMLSRLDECSYGAELAALWPDVVGAARAFAG